MVNVERPLLFFASTANAKTPIPESRDRWTASRNKALPSFRPKKVRSVAAQNWRHFVATELALSVPQAQAGRLK